MLHQHMKNPIRPSYRIIATRLVTAVGALAGAASPLAHAASISWSSTAGSTDWATGSNWVGGIVPSAADVAVFNQGSYASQPNAGTSSVGGILVGSSSAPVTISGTSLTIGSDGLRVSAGAGATTFSSPVKLATGLQPWNVSAGSTLALARIGAGASATDVYGPDGAIAILPASGTKTTTNVNGWDWRGPSGSRSGLLGPGMVIDNGDGTYDWASANSGVIGAATYYAAGTGDRNNVLVTGNTTLTLNASWASLKVSGATFTANGSNLYMDTGLILQNGGTVTGSAPLKANSDGLYVYTPDSGAIGSSVQNNGANVKKLYKAGAGLLTLSGANTYTGDTFLYQGKLQLGHSTASIGTGALKVTDGTVGGAGGAVTTVTGKVHTIDGGRVAPGAITAASNFGGVGTLTLTSTGAGGGVNFVDAGFDFDLATTAAGSSDRLALGASAVTYGSIGFTFSGTALETGQAYTLISGTGSVSGFNASSISSTFVGALAGHYSASYGLGGVSGGDLQVTFTAVPEPSSFAVLVGLAGLAMVGSRRRRR